jgi:uncharacterized protein YndB with AHSA1/START domain
MSVLSIVLLIIVVLLAIVFIGAASLSNEYTITRSISINRPLQQVFDYVKLLKSQEQYNKWVMTDPQARVTMRGVDGTPGAVYTWDSDNKQMGKGEQEIKAIAEGKSIDQQIRFEKPFKSTSWARLTTTPVNNNETTVQYSFGGVRNFGMKVPHFLFNLSKMLGKDVEISLANLKKVLEGK